MGNEDNKKKPHKNQACKKLVAFVGDQKRLFLCHFRLAQE